ncbi:MAG: hypothetical protein Q4E24_03500 [bacterium]|nr:hypothetical protein [bacterium]
MGKFAADETLIKEAGRLGEKGLDEIGKTSRNRSDNKTKRHVSDNSANVEIHKSDNNTGVEHHKLNISNLNNIMNNVLNGIDTLSSSFVKVNDSINDRIKTNKEHEAKLEKLKNDREEIYKALEKTKGDFEIAKLKIESHSADRMKVFDKSVDSANDAWNKIFNSEIFKNKNGQEFIACMNSLNSIQENINKLSSELINSVSNK